jgi:WD40 repeat protein
MWRLDAPEPIELQLPDHGWISCCFEPRSDRCALAYPDQTIRLVRLAAPRLTERTLRHRIFGDAHLAWCPRRPLLAVWAPNSDVCQLVDVENGAVCGELRIPSNITSIDWHPHGEILAVAGHDRRIHLLDTGSGRDVLPPLEAHLNYGIVCCFSHSGDWLASDDWSEVLRVWDTRTGQQILTHGGGTPRLQFSHDDRLLGPVVSGTKVRLMRSVQANAFRIVRAGGGSGILEHPGRPCTDDKGHWLAVASERGAILIDVARGREAALLALPGNYPLRFDDDERALWTHGRDGLLRWPIRGEVASAGQIRVGPPERLGRPNGAARWGASRNGSILGIPTFDGASLWHRPSNRVLRVAQHQEDVRNCAVSPDGRWAATGSHWLQEGSGAKVWDAASGRHVADLPVGGTCDVVFSPAGKWLTTSGGGCRLWEVGTWREGAKLGSPTENASRAFTVDDKLLALGDQPGVVRLVSPETGRELARLTIPEAEHLWVLCFTADSRHLAATGSESHVLYLFDLATIRKELRELGLDWDDSQLPPLSEDPIARVHLTVELGTLAPAAAAGELVDTANRLEERKNYRESLTTLREAIKIDPDHVVANNNLAWLLVTGPIELRDAQSALPLARKAAEKEPKNAFYLNTLGVALYRNGQYAEAISVLQKSLAASRGSCDGFDLFFLAMCHHWLGQAAKAKDCYDRALNWVKKNRFSSDWLADLAAFQAEAEALLAPGKAQ